MIQNVWRGDYGLKVMFWGWFVGGHLVALIILLGLLSALQGEATHTLSSRFFVLVVAAIITFAYSLVVSVGTIWEAIRNFEQFKGWSIAAILVVIGVWTRSSLYFDIQMS